MKHDCPALPLAVGFFLIWLGVLYLGADHPPPRGFAWLVLLALVAAVLVFVRAPVYAGWQVSRRPRRRLRALRDGALTGLAFGALTLAVSAVGSGGLPALGFAPVLVWLGVLTLVGIVNAGLLSAAVSWACAAGGRIAA